MLTSPRSVPVEVPRRARCLSSLLEMKTRRRARSVSGGRFTASFRLFFGLRDVMLASRRNAADCGIFRIARPNVAKRATRCDTWMIRRVGASFSQKTIL